MSEKTDIIRIDRKRKHPLSAKNSSEAKQDQTASKSRKPKSGATSDQLKQLDEYFMVKHSAKLLEFWEQAVELNPESPTDAFSELNSLKLVGPFSLLDDLRKGKSTTVNGYLLSHRFSTDLPEMETIMLYRGQNRFCFWRDRPDEPPQFIVHVAPADKEQSPNFPKFTIVGDADPFCALAYLLMDDKDSSASKDFQRFFPATFDLKAYNRNFLQKLKDARKRASLGKPFHGLGIRVEVNNKEVGYRPVTENPERLKHELQQYGSTKNEAERKTLKDQLFKLYSCVQFANDEMDFGMGLEFGHDLFVSGYECFDGMAKSVLSIAYVLLGRKEFATILDKHWGSGRRANELKLID